MADYTQFKALLQKYTGLFEELTKIQEEKIEAIRNYNMESLDECMKKEQADTLLIRGYDKKRQLMQEELGVKDQTLQEILLSLPSDQQPEFNQVFRQLDSAYTTYNTTADCAKQMIEVNIYRLGNAINAIKKTINAETGEVYSSTGSIPPESISFRDMKI